jgi:tetratricopeptide (TPR) repeat protein
MALRQFFAKLTGAAPAVNVHELEYQRHSQAGDGARRQRAYTEAEGHYRDGLALARSYQDSHATEVFLGLLGALYTEQERYDEAATVLNEAKDSALRSPEVFRKARAMLNVGAHHLLRSADQAAQAALEEAVTLAKQAGDIGTYCLATCNLADLYMRQSNPGYALRLLREALPHALNNPQQATNLLGRLGKAHLSIGEGERGRTALTQALNFAEQNGQPEQALQWRILLAERAYEDGQLQDALTHYAQIDVLASSLTDTERSALSPAAHLKALAQQAFAHLVLGNTDAAWEYATRALERAKSIGDVRTQANVLLTLGNAYQRANNTTDATHALQEAIALFNATPDPALTADHVKALNALGNIYQEADQAEQAITQFEAALALAAEDDLIGRAGTLRSIGNLRQKQNQLAETVERWQEALALYEKAGAASQAARMACDIGGVRRQLSGINAALADFERATTLLSNVKDANTRGYILSNVANLYTDLGDVDTAQSFYQESIHLARQGANRRAESLRLGNFGWFYVLTGRAGDGLRLLEEALTISRTLNDRLLLAVQTSNMGLAHHEMKDYALAEFAFRDAIITAEKLGETRWAATFRSNLGRTLLAQGKPDDAHATLTTALAVLRTAGDQEALARTLVRLGDVHLRAERLDEAEAAAREGEGLARKWGYRKGVADALLVRAGIAKGRGDDERYMDALREARKLYAILHDPIADDLERVLGEEPDGEAT